MEEKDEKEKEEEETGTEAGRTEEEEEEERGEDDACLVFFRVEETDLLGAPRGFVLCSGATGDDERESDDGPMISSGLDAAVTATPARLFPSEEGELALKRPLSSI